MCSEDVRCVKCKWETSDGFDGMCLRCAVRTIFNRVTELEEDLKHCEMRVRELTPPA